MNKQAYERCLIAITKRAGLKESLAEAVEKIKQSMRENPRAWVTGGSGVLGAAIGASLSKNRLAGAGVGGALGAGFGFGGYTGIDALLKDRKKRRQDKQPIAENMVEDNGSREYGLSYPVEAATMTPEDQDKLRKSIDAAQPPGATHLFNALVNAINNGASIKPYKEMVGQLGNIDATRRDLARYGASLK